MNVNITSVNLNINCGIKHMTLHLWTEKSVELSNATYVSFLYGRRNSALDYYVFVLRDHTMMV